MRYDNRSWPHSFSPHCLSYLVTPLGCQTWLTFDLGVGGTWHGIYFGRYSWILGSSSPCWPLSTLSAPNLTRPHLPLRLQLLQSIEESAPLLDPTRRTSPPRCPTHPEPRPPPSTLAEFEGLLPTFPNPKTPPKKPSLRSVLFWLAGIFRWHPFLSSALLYAILTGLVAGVAKSPYNRDRRQPGAIFTYDGGGVSFSLVSSSWVRTDTTYYISQIAIVGSGYQIDTTSKTLSITWKVFGCGTYMLPPSTDPDAPHDPRCGACNRAMDIYINEWVYVGCQCPRSNVYNQQRIQTNIFI